MNDREESPSNTLLSIILPIVGAMALTFLPGNSNMYQSRVVESLPIRQYAILPKSEEDREKLVSDLRNAKRANDRASRVRDYKETMPFVGLNGRHSLGRYNARNGI